MAIQSSPTEAQPQKSNKACLIVLTVSLVLFLFLLFVGLLGFFFIRAQKEAKVANQIATAQQLIDQRQLYDAVQILDEVIANNPDNAEAYRWRSIAYGQSRSNVYTEQEGFYRNALKDINKLMELEPTNGNNYVNRNLILRGWAGMIPDSATQFYLYELANESTEKAIELGVTPDYSYVYRHHARNLIESGHCEEGLKETRALIEQTLVTDPNMYNYNIYLTEAYMCLNKLDKALEYAQKITCDDKWCSASYTAQIYYHMGKYDKALEILNDMINSSPAGGGWRYFMRADIFYEQGHKDLVQQDLDLGDGYTWYGNGVYWYVLAKMAFEEGDEKTGIEYLQQAESTLDIQYNPLRQKILQKLEEYGVGPLNASANPPFDIPPIP